VDGSKWMVGGVCDLEVSLGVLRSGSERLVAAYREVLEGRFTVLPFDGERAARAGWGKRQRPVWEWAACMVTGSISILKTVRGLRSSQRTTAIVLERL